MPETTTPTTPNHAVNIHASFLDEMTSKCEQMMQQYWDDNPDHHKIVQQKKQQAAAVILPEANLTQEIQNVDVPTPEGFCRKIYSDNKSIFAGHT